MIVTQITGMTRARYKIYVDDQFAFVLYKGELREFGMEEGKEISMDLFAAGIRTRQNF